MYLPEYAENDRGLWCGYGEGDVKNIRDAGTV